MFFRYCLASLLALGSAGIASADTWADKMFDELSRDFGSVPRGPTLQHPFRLVNNTGRTVRIVGVRVSCGCTQARALQSTLAPGQETAILATMDTTRFFGHKSVTIFVTLGVTGWLGSKPTAAAAMPASDSRRTGSSQRSLRLWCPLA